MPKKESESEQTKFDLELNLKKNIDDNYIKEMNIEY